MYKAICKKSVAILLTVLLLLSVIPVFSLTAFAADSSSTYKVEQLNAEPWGSCEDDASTPKNKDAQDAWWNEYGSQREGGTLLENIWNLREDNKFNHHVVSRLEGEGENGTLWYDVNGRLTIDINLDDNAESFNLLSGWGQYAYCTVLAQKPGDDKWYIVGRVFDEAPAGQTVFANAEVGLTEDVIKNTYKYILANDNLEKKIRLQFIPDNEYGVKPATNAGKISIANIVYSVETGDGVIDSSEYTVPHFYNAADYPAHKNNLLGDANEDGRIDILDLIALKKALLDNKDFNIIMDINKDKSLNALDFTASKKNIWNEAPAQQFTTVFDVNVTEYGAKGDGVTNDRAAIQAAIDAANAAGGGTVRLDAGKTFISGNLRIRSNVTFIIEEGAILRQSANPNDFVNPLKNYEPFQLTFGLYLDLSIEWNAAAFYNFPFILVSEGTENVKITGTGAIEGEKGNDPRGEMTMQLIGLFRANNYEISNITLRKYHAYCLKATSCMNGLYKNITIDNSEGTVGGTDGINLTSCKNIRVTGCNLNTGDDGIYIGQSYNDPRERNLWYNLSNPLTPSNIEIDHNHCNVIWDETKAFCFIMWGEEIPDQRLADVNNIYIHDNYFETAGAWTGHWNGETGKFEYSTKCNPMKNIRFENNTFGSIQGSFYTLPISDLISVGNKLSDGTPLNFDSMKTMRNTDFSKYDTYWVSRNGSSAGYSDGYGYIENLDKVDAALYQGINLTANTNYKFSAKVKSSGDPVRLFVKDQITGTIIASKEFTNTEWKTVSLEFSVPKTCDYHIGIERGNATKGYGYIDDASCVVFNGIPDDAAETSVGNTIHTDQIPDYVGDGGGWRNAYGTKFGTTVAGKITKVRLYTSYQESGEHLVSIWNYDTNTMLTEKVYTWDISIGYEGWREFTLPTPVSITPGTTYVVSVTAGPDCLYSADLDLFSQPMSNGYLYTFANSGLSSSNAYAATYAMPDSPTAASVFRDVEFIPDNAEEIIEDSLFEEKVPTAVHDGGGWRNAYGTKFGTTKAGKITKVRIYTSANEGGEHLVSIWNYDTKTMLTEQVYSWNITAGYEGWREFTLPTPVSIAPGNAYVVSVTAGTDCLYVLESDGLKNQISSEYLYTFEKGGLYSSNAYAATYAMPDTVTSANVFRDVVFVPNK